MNIGRKIVAWALLTSAGAWAVPAAATTYQFISSSGQVASFGLTVSQPVTSNTTFLRSQLDYATGNFYKVDFCVASARCNLGNMASNFDEITVYDNPYVGPAIPAIDPLTGMQLINPVTGQPIFATPTAVSVSYDFAPTAFAQTGVYRSIAAGSGLLGVNSSLLPEPGSWAMQILGLGLVGSALRRRRVAIAGCAGVA